MTDSLTGAGTLVRLALRRDRVMLPVWIVVLAVLALGSAASVADLYPSAAARAAFAAGAGNNAATVAMYGPSYDLDTLGGIATWKMGTFGAVLLALMSIVVVLRHTRGDEEHGRLELVGAGVVGRRAPLTAAVLVALGANLVAAVAVWLALAAGGVPAGGAFAFGFALAAAGWVFTGVAAVAAQLTGSARTATGISAGVLVAAFLLRAVGDSVATWLSWISPLGWTLAVRAFSASPRWWVFALAAAVTAALLATGYALVSRRDFAAGLLPDRPGPAGAGRSLRGPFGLAWRLHRGTLLGWAIGYAVGGAGLGSIASSVADFTGGESGAAGDVFRRLGGARGLIDAYLGATMSILGIVAAGYAVQATLRLRGEESALRAEPLLAARLGRGRWVASHLVFTVFGTGVLLALAGTAAGLTHGLRVGDVGGQVPRVLGAAMIQLPAALLVASIAVALFGVLPRLTVAAWGVLGAFLVVSLFGELFRLDQWVLDVSPFTHVPRLPGGSASATPVVWLLAIAVVLTGAGLLSFRGRDIG